VRESTSSVATARQTPPLPAPGTVVYPAACPSRTLLNHVTSTWGVLVLAALSQGTLRWSELRRAAQGVSEKMLAQTLQTLERDGLVSRYQHPVMPPRVDYSLTELGRELAERLLPLLDWVSAHADQLIDPPNPQDPQTPPIS
jgi:DNA-binding HxlR family transcriptional regulator